MCIANAKLFNSYLPLSQLEEALKLHQGFLSIESGPFENSFFVIWLNSLKEEVETLVSIKRTCDSYSFSFRNGNPHIIESIEQLMPSILTHCNPQLKE